MSKYINPYTDLREPIEEAAVARLTSEQHEAYQRSRLSYLSTKGVIETAFEDGMEKGIERGKAEGIAEGIEQGIEQGKAEAALGFYSNGVPIDIIAKSLRITEAQVLAIIAAHEQE